VNRWLRGEGMRMRMRMRRVRRMRRWRSVGIMTRGDRRGVLRDALGWGLFRLY
ncbi:hypothetical protein RJZ57_008568, partial [Blastomyces gilchristii]